MIVHLSLAMLASASAYRPPQVVERWVEPMPAPRGERRLQRLMLDAHNRARAAVGVAPLAWDARLAADAASYAAELARTGRFAHAVQPVGPTRQGENLWTGTRGAYRYEEMAAHWVGEGRDFVNAPTPQFSRTGRWQDVAHYTQIVWRGTTRVGCALAANATTDYLVCRYAPAGNVVGLRAY